MIKFNDDENVRLDRQIKITKLEINKKIKDCESNIKDISNSKIATTTERGGKYTLISVRENMKTNIVAKLQEFIKRFKVNEEGYYRKYKDLVGEDQHSIDSKAGMIGSNFLQQGESHDDILKQREVEINNIVKSINELTAMFKDLQTLVVEQGTILDRIDYNIETAERGIIDANKELTKADKNLSSNCARNANLTLIVIIFFLALLILMKFK
jgi:syntaxin 16